jgi:hypothetical protein
MVDYRHAAGCVHIYTCMLAHALEHTRAHTHPTTFRIFRTKLYPLPSVAIAVFGSVPLANFNHQVYPQIAHH